MQTANRLEYLLDKMEQRTASEAECQELLNLIDADESGTITERINAFHAARPDIVPQPDFEGSQWKQGIHEVLNKYKTRENTIPDAAPVGRLRSLRRIGWAAAAVLVITAGAYLFLTIKETPTAVEPVGLAQQQPILPGTNGARLTLADGSTVSLDDAKDGLIAAQQGANAVLKNGSLSYAAANAGGTIVYNTLSTPKGRQFHMELADGSKVWLNAGSSIRFPTAFQGSERKVEITGEAYFEVAPNSASPFIVNVNNRAAIEVLGTSFNINAYDNEEQLSTTLFSGSVRMANNATHIANTATVVLKPGQQGRMNNHGSTAATGISVSSDIDTDKIIAWKNGFFNFGKASLREVMRQLERWYDIEVVYEKDVPNPQFIGKMTRNISLQDLFQILESSEVNFRIEGKKVIVTK
ncbi:MAG: FecR domain-containing protein [Pseudobacter sp.]|uniref:FecR domain-containing protein n=1 Tax=Pseudobacter sp. TaxID=2045420 RepID=UPI003F821774